MYLLLAHEEGVLCIVHDDHVIQTVWGHGPLHLEKIQLEVSVATHKQH